jgi:hypothetical protein
MINLNKATCEEMKEFYWNGDDSKHYEEEIEKFGGMAESTKDLTDLIKKTPLQISLEWCTPSYVDISHKKFPGNENWYSKISIVGRTNSPNWQNNVSSLGEYNTKRKEVLKEIFRTNKRNSENRKIILSYKSRINESSSEVKRKIGFLKKKFPNWDKPPYLEEIKHW